MLAGYVGVACGLFATALACAAAGVFLFFFGDPFDYADMVLGDNGLYWLLFILAISAFLFGISVGAGAGPVKCVEALQARSRFSRLLRRPSDQRTATVVALKRDGRTLILDIPWDGPGRGYQPLSEVRLALWMKAGMLVPGERVTVDGGPGGDNPLLISSAQRARAFLGTMNARSAVQPGPVAPLDERVSAATLVDWAAWAAATTFSYTRLGSSYGTAEVEAFRSAIRDTFLGVGEPPVRSDDVRGKQFSTHWLREGHDKKQVDAFLDAAAIRLAAMESRDRPAEPLLVSGPTLVAWAEWADSATFTEPRIGKGYTPKEVDAFREEIRDTFLGATRSPVKSRRRRALRSSSSEWREVTNGVRGPHFSSPSSEEPRGYDEKQVYAFLDAAGIRLAAMESTDRPAGPLVSEAILAEWAEWADSTRFSTTPRLREGYATAEVDAFRKELRDTFLGTRQAPLTWHEVQRKWPGSGYHEWFSTTRGWSRPGYDVQEVDAFLRLTKLRLAAIRLLEPGSWPILRIDRPAAPPVSKAILARWAAWADSTTFSIRRRRDGYDTAEVDAFVEAIRDTLHGMRPPPLTWPATHGNQFTTTRPGYDAEQVDAFLDKAEPRLAAMRATDQGAT